MKETIKGCIRNAAAIFGLTINQMVEKKDLIDLITSLRPVKTNIDLIRFGSSSDGGYLIPDDLEGIVACFSPGVDKVSDFERDCINTGIKVFMADKSVDKPDLSLDESMYSFIRKFIGATNDETYITMDKWVNDSLPSDNCDLILQMDIETSAYKSLINMSDRLLERFRIIVIEFHYLHKLWEPLFFDFASAVFNKILKSHYCVHIHPNNCNGVERLKGIEIPRVAEFSFIRKDRATVVGKVSKLPHELDRDNTSNSPIYLTKLWYS